MGKAVQAGVYTQGADIIKGQVVIGQNNGSVKAAQEATGTAGGVAQGVTNQTVEKSVKRAGDADKYIEGASEVNVYKQEQAIEEVKQKKEDGYTAKKMATSVVAAEEIKANQTEQLIAAFGSKEKYVKAAANAGADNELKNIEATEAEAKEMDKARVGDGSQVSKLKNMGVAGSFKGTEKGSEEARSLGEIAYDRLGDKVGKVPSNIDATKAAAPSREKLKEYQGKLAEYANDQEGFKQAIKGDRELEAIDRHFTAGVNDAPMVARANNFNRALADYRTKLAQQKGGFDASQTYGNLTQDQQIMKSLDLPDNNDGRARLAELQNHGLLNEREAAAINRGYGFKPGEGPFQKGMIIESYGVGKDGKMMVNKASSQGPDGKSVTVADGEVKTSQAMNRKQLEKYAQSLDKDHALEAFAVRGMAGRLGKGESAKVNETRGFDGHFISSNVMHGGDANLKGGGGESLELKNGQAVQAGTVTEKNLPGLLKDAKKAGFTELEGIKPGSQYQQQWGVDGGGKPVLTGMSVKKEGESSYKDLAQEKTGKIKQKVDEDMTKIRKGKDEDIGDHISYGDTASYHLGSNNISPRGLFQVGGMNLVAASVERDGDQYRVIGTNHLGYHVEMQGRSKNSPSINVKDGKYDGLKDFEMTNLKVSQTRDTEISNTYTDRNKITIDQQDDISMSNLNKLRERYGESPEEFVKNHQDLIMAYGVGKNALENFKEGAKWRGAKSVAEKQPAKANEPISGGNTDVLMGKKK